jgi:hypothetical protein
VEGFEMELGKTEQRENARELQNETAKAQEIPQPILLEGPS